MSHRMLLAILLLSVSGPGSAVTLTSSTAGFAGTLSQYCEMDANNFQINILYNINLCQRRGIVEFDVSGIGLTSVNSAVLTLYDGAVGNSEAWYWTVDVYGYIGDGQVTNTDFNVGDYITTATWFRYAPNGVPFLIDVTDYINGQLALGTSIVGFNLRANGEYNCASCATTSVSFDGAGGDLPPTLTLQSVPIPATAWLLGGALFALGAIRRRVAS